jgi:GTP:adenosylcobinamide-phosphate guanylyltransferase
MKQAMIFAAGLGTRLKPLTDSMPKALVRVGGQPLLWHVVTKLRDAGYGRIVVNVHHFAQQIVDYLAENDNFGLDIRISDETDQLLETGGGLKKAQALFDPDEPILIHNVDILENVDFDWLRRRHLEDEDAVLLVSRRTTQRYLLFDNAMRLMGWKNTVTGEVKSPFQWLRESDFTIDDHLQVQAQPNSQLSALSPQLYAFAFSGIHSFSPRLFPLMNHFPDRFSIMDFYLSVCHRSHVMGLLKEDLQVLDVGKLNMLDEANEFIINISK